MFEAVVSDLIELTDTGLDERIDDLELQIRRTEAELAAAIAVADARQLHHNDAHRSMKGYLKATCNLSNHDVSRWRSAAAGGNAPPSIGDAWIRGRIGSPQVTVLAKANGNRRVRDAFPAFLPFLVANAEEMCFEDFTATVDYLVKQADAEGAHDQRDDVIGHRRARVKPNGEAVDMHVFGGDGVTTDEIIGIYETFCDAELDNDIAARRDLHGNDAHNHDLARTAAQRSYDAIIAIFRAAAAAGVAGSVGNPAATSSTSSPTRRRLLGSSPPPASHPPASMVCRWIRSPDFPHRTHFSRI